MMPSSPKEEGGLDSSWEVKSHLGGLFSYECIAPEESEGIVQKFGLVVLRSPKWAVPVVMSIHAQPG